MNREEKFKELDEEINKLSKDEKNFVLWLLLREYKDGMDIPEHLDTIEDYRKYMVNHGLYIGCSDLIDMLSWELWR